MLDLQKFQTLLETEMTRRQFLMHIGTALLAVIGIPFVFKAISSTTASLPQKTPQPKPQLGAYGWSGYSGIPPKNSLLNTKVIQ
jgi:hypothetical protein